jgi:Ca-activated chloride channel family protein
MKYVLLFLLLCFGSQLLLGQSASPYFLVQGGPADFTLAATAADVRISGVIADVTVRQTYVNRGPSTLEATYVFPAGTGAAVYAMRMRVGERIIEGEVMRKAAARQTYETAKREGKRASLLEQHRPNVFQMSVAGIQPGDTVAVELRYTELLVPESGRYAFVYPTVVGPRFTGENTNAGSTGSDYTDQPYTPAAAAPPFTLKLELDAGMPIAELGSPSHRIRSERPDATTARLTLDGAESGGADRDFVLEYRLGGTGVQTGMLLFEGEEENYFLYLAQPPLPTNAPAAEPAKEFVFVVDVSGSMNGFPLGVAKDLLQRLTDGLRPTDRFNILLFAGAGQTWQPVSVAATPENVAAAKDFLTAARGGGGTRLLSALEHAFALPLPDRGISRNFVILTDGYISVEPEVFELIDRRLGEANVYAFGIGRSVNRHLIEGMARIGRGRPAFVLDPSDARTEAERFRRYITAPVLTNVRLDYGKFDAYEMEPFQLPDLTRERPLVVFGKYRGKARGALQLSGQSGSGSWSSVTSVSKRDADARHAALAYLWARHRIQRLADYNNLRHDDERVEEVTRLGLTYNLLTPYTSFVAVDKTPVLARADTARTVRQPLPLPAGVSATAVGFSLLLTGVSGLPANTESTGWPWWSYLVVGLVMLFFAVTYKMMRSLPAALLVMAFCMSCEREAVSFEVPGSAGTCVPAPPAIRPANITFILGEDEGTNTYYERAERYFRQREEEVVTQVRNLEGVRNYLSRHRPDAGWDTIHLVAHGNPWTGLAIGSQAHTERTTAAMLGSWWPDPVEGISARTRIELHGCGLGRDTALLNELSRILGGEKGYPLVTAVEQFTLFREGPAGSQRHYANAYFRARPLGDYPLPKVMAVRLRRQHPEVDIDWLAALNRNRFSADLEPYLFQFNVPVEWTRVHPEGGEVTLPETKAEKREWPAGERGLQEQLAAIGLSDRDFRWTYRRSRYLLADGRSIPAVMAKGSSRLFCVLVPTGRPHPVSRRYLGS